MSLFSNRLVFARKKSGLTQQEVADHFHLTRSAYSAWEVGRNEPSFDVLVQLCQKLNVSADYLLGLSDSLTVSQPIPVSIPTSSVQRDPLFGLTPDQRELIETNIATMRKQNEKALATSTQEA